MCGGGPTGLGYLLTKPVEAALGDRDSTYTAIGCSLGGHRLRSRARSHRLPRPTFLLSAAPGSCHKQTPSPRAGAGEAGGPGAAPGPSPASPAPCPLLLPRSRRPRGSPRAECACLFKRPRGAPRGPPGDAGGGHGRGRLAPGGRGSTTKLRPLSLRIGWAPQTGGGRALSCPSLSRAVPGPGVGRCSLATSALVRAAVRPPPRFPQPGNEAGWVWAPAGPQSPAKGQPSGEGGCRLQRPWG